ncbi:MAG: hypothetical protein ACI9CA_000016 [Natronomonas sp.]|jgi:hypothetical protein
MTGPRYPTADEYDPEYDHYNDDDAPKPEEMAEKMGLARGTDWSAPDGGEVIRVVTSERFGDVTISDPTVTNPMDSRAGNWEHHVAELYAAWRRGNLVPVVADDGFQPATPGEDAAPELAEQVNAGGPSAEVSFGDDGEAVTVTLHDAEGDEVDEVTLPAVEVKGAMSSGATYTLGADG